ncbi:hypothetical protein G3N57_05830 [Paraburkholderia sp. Se-20369]|nr:hypothetical protein [Paraburkholderia sp. Se-20369]
MRSLHKTLGLRLARAKRISRIAMLVVAIGPATACAQTNDQPDPCLYGFEWLHKVRFPLQPDPHAAYSYIAPKLPTDGTPVGFLVEGDYPYSTWFSWTMYDAQAQAVSVMSDKATVPAPGSVNPFVIGNRVMEPKRHYRMLLLPNGATAGSSLADIPNKLTIPTDVATSILAYRVYQAFPGYNLGGSGGETHTPFPAIYAVNYKTGEKLSCSAYNAIPASVGHLPTDTPPVDNLYGTNPPPNARKSADHSAHAAAKPQTQSPIPPKWQYAPVIDPTLVTFTRPPLLPGADVSSIPPPDQCAGYLGAGLNPNKIAIIRIPQVPTVFDTLTLNGQTVFPDTQGAYYSLVMYGASVGTYAPGEPITTALADSELKPDATGGSTLVVWPRDLPNTEREELFTYARAQGWALLRNGKAGDLTSANMLIRLKGASASYYGAYTPLPGVRTGVPCYFNDKPNGTLWSALEGASDPMTYVASFQNLGNAAPQGVECTSTADALNGACLGRLQDYIHRTGGKYSNPGSQPPPSVASQK